jgi:hypothetical protein
MQPFGSFKKVVTLLVLGAIAASTSSEKLCNINVVLTQLFIGLLFGK